MGPKTTFSLIVKGEKIQININYCGKKDSAKIPLLQSPKYNKFLQAMENSLFSKVTEGNEKPSLIIN